MLLNHFFPKDDNLGELMSTVCGVHVRGWAGVGACSAEGGRRPGRTRRRAARGRLCVVQEATPSKPATSTNGRFYWEEHDVALVFVDLPPAGPRKAVKRHKGRL